jgi:hypothetical protein
MHIKSKENHIFGISVLLLHVSALHERHLQEAQRILIKLCVCYVISAELSKGREWILSVCSQSKEPSLINFIYTYCLLTHHKTGHLQACGSLNLANISRRNTG